MFKKKINIDSIINQYLLNTDIQIYTLEVGLDMDLEATFPPGRAGAAWGALEQGKALLGGGH